MPSNTSNYARKYYEEVVKPKRKKEQAERKRELKDTLVGQVVVIQRTCPVCGKVWEETIEWKANRTPSPKKQCRECIVKKQKEYTDRPEVRKKINARLRKRYATQEDLRMRKKASSDKWRIKKNIDQ